jgi:predicted anti-sigma-YlaC factor YlaD
MTEDDFDFSDVCPERVPLLVRAVDGALETAELVALEAHLAECARCRAAFEGQRIARAHLMSWSPAAAPADFVARVLRDVDAHESWLDRWDFRRWTWRLAPLATAAAIAMGIVVGRTDVSYADAPSTDSIAETTGAETSGAGAAGAGAEGAEMTGDVTVAAAILSEDLSGDAVLGLLLTAEADEPIAEALEELSQ